VVATLVGVAECMVRGPQAGVSLRLPVEITDLAGDPVRGLVMDESVGRPAPLTAAPSPLRT
jgi:hypothetical protein